MEVGDRNLTTDIINSKLVYFVKGDGSSDGIVTLQGDRAPSGARGLKIIFGDKGSAGSSGLTGKRGGEGTKLLLERLVKW